MVSAEAGAPARQVRSDQSELGFLMVFSRRPSAKWAAAKRASAKWAFTKWVGRRIVGTVLALAGAAFLVVGSAEARVGSAKNFGSRGAKTFTTPPSTNTAPKAAQPVQRSATQAGASQSAAKPSFMSRFGGLGGLLAGGLIGAALASMLGLGGGLAGMLGFILQAALIGGLIYLAVQFFRRRSGAAAGPSVATASAMPDRKSTRLNSSHSS